MNRLRTWLADKITSIAYRIEARAERWHEFSNRIRPKLRYEDMDELQKLCHRESMRMIPGIIEAIGRGPFATRMGTANIEPIRSVVAERPLA